MSEKIDNSPLNETKNTPEKPNKVWNFLKNKVFTKRVGFSLFGVGLVAATTAVIVYKATKEKYKPVFYNFQSYLDKDMVEKLNESFEYKNFSMVEEFSKALITNKATAGISSDAQAAKLIINEHEKSPKLRKFKRIEFKELWGENWDDSKTTLDNLKVIYTAPVIEHLLKYDVYFEDLVIYDKDGNPVKKDGKVLKNIDLPFEERIHLYDYFIPYYVQDMVVAYNPLKLKSYKRELKKNGASGYFKKAHNEFEHQINKRLYEVFNDPHNDNKITIIDSLRSVSWPYGIDNKENDRFEHYSFTNSVRDVMIYGSSYRFNTETGRYESQLSGDAVIKEQGTITGTQLETPIYKDLIDQFINLFEHGSGYKIDDTAHVKTSGDGQELLNDLVDPEKATGVGIIYNGDALDAYYSEDNISDTSIPEGVIRYIRPSANLLLLDGLVISSDADDETVSKIINTAKTSYFGGLNKTKDHWTKEKLEYSFENDPIDKALEKYGAYKNFEYIMYTPAQQILYDYVLENEFEESVRVDASEEIQNYEKDYLKNLFIIKSGNERYKIGHKNTTAFEGWNEIEYFVEHIAISPVNHKVETEINTYYYKRMKD